MQRGTLPVAATPQTRGTRLDWFNGRLRDQWLRILYRPPWWAVFLNPYYVVRKGLYREIARIAGRARGRMLDFGAGSAPYRTLFRCEQYLTVDIADSGYKRERKVADVYYDGHTLPFPPGHFDFILSSEVLEHVFNLEEILSELYRVLRPGGELLVTVPFVWEEHEQPHDFARYTSFALPFLLERQGLTVQRLTKTTGYLETLFQMGVVYLLNRKFLARVKPLKLVASIVLFAPLLLIGMGLTRLLPRDDRLYHNLVVLAKKSSAAAQ